MVLLGSFRKDRVLRSNEFVSAVLKLQPRVAAFDCDGTLWSGDAGESFFDWELARNAFLPKDVSDAIRSRHRAYKEGKVDETTMCGEMVAMHHGMADSALRQAAEEFFPRIASNIFPEMQELVARLHDAGCEIWAVSSSNQWVIAEGMRLFGIPANRILSAEVEIVDGVITNYLLRVPSGPGKVLALREVAKKQVDAAFGNSRWDAEMLEMATHAFAVNPNPDLRLMAQQQGWTIYVPAGMQPKE
jgi:HAD superfamily phosphoserine phosphatase-like hydrolase